MHQDRLPERSFILGNVRRENKARLSLCDLCEFERTQRVGVR